MDTFDPNIQPEEHIPQDPVFTPEPTAEEPVIPQQTPPQPTYRGQGTGRKESPYADSPYVAYQRPQYEGHYQYQAEPPKKQKKNRTSGFWKKAGAAVLAIALLIGSNAVTATLVSNELDAELEETQREFDRQIQDLKQQIASNSGAVLIGGSVAPGEALTPAQVYAKNVSSVVAISATVQSTGFYGSTESASSGSGFILTEDGYVVTNCHVIEGATSVSIITHDGTEIPAKIVGSDDNNDVAVLKAEAEGLIPVTLGSSNDLIIGDMVVAIGNPLGELTSTQTVGYVSGKGREVATGQLTTISMIQTDAAINPGNSGGPLFNMAGEVVGITTAKYSGLSASGASIEGIGFAIPMDDAAGIIDDLMEFGYVRSAYLGISVYSVLPSDAEMFGRPLGCLVNEVNPGSCADIAGLKKADVITGLGGYKVESYTDLSRALRTFNGGEHTTVTVDRSGQTLVLEITLDEKPREEAPASSDVPSYNEPSGIPDGGSYQDWFDYFFGE